MRSNSCRPTIVAGLILALCACGGGQGGPSFIGTPPSSPTPTPTPTTVPSTPPFGLSSDQQFATYAANTSDSGAYSVNAADPNALSFSWSQQAQAYEVKAAGFPAAHLERTFASNLVAFHPVDASGNQLPLSFAIYVPPLKTDVQLSYGSWGIYETYPSGSTSPFVYTPFAFGVPTAAGDVPTTGSATYQATLHGLTDDHYYEILGDSQLSFDFGSGSLSGHMQPRLFDDWDGINQPLGQYDFAQTAYSGGSRSFGGHFAIPNGTPGQVGGAFDGQFVGPKAVELISGWTAPYLDPFDHHWGTMNGIWLGKKQ